MIKLRLHFSKTGRARFISHLDLMQVLKRSMLRTDMPLRYSEGYNPHAVMSIALPLPVGVDGLREVADFDFLRPIQLDTLPGKLNATLPEGIVMLDAAIAARPVREITKARYDICFHNVAERLMDLRNIFDSRTLVVEKRTKKGRADIDITPLIDVERIYVSGADGNLHLQVLLPVVNTSLSPEHVLAAVSAESDLAENASAVRLCILGDDGVEF